MFSVVLDNGTGKSAEIDFEVFAPHKKTPLNKKHTGEQGAFRLHPRHHDINTHSHSNSAHSSHISGGDHDHHGQHHEKKHHQHHGAYRFVFRNPSNFRSVWVTFALGRELARPEIVKSNIF